MNQRSSDKKPADNPAKNSRAKSQSGRVTAPKDRSSGRYTPPVPNIVKHSPRWYPWVLLSLIFAGVICIILNYIAVLPDSPSNWYTLGSLLAIVTAALMATNYR